MLATILLMFHWAISLRLHFWPYARFFAVQGVHGPSGSTVIIPTSVLSSSALVEIIVRNSLLFTMAVVDLRLRFINKKAVL